MRIHAFLGLGANLGDPPAQLIEALRIIDDTESTKVLRRAPIYRSKPVGPPGQPDYANTVAEIATELEPEALLDLAKSVEDAMGRVTTVRWGPRVIDVDVLVYGDIVLATPRLVIPHRELANRRFVLQPMCDLCPDLVVPGTGKSVRHHLATLSDDPRSVWRE